MRRAAALMAAVLAGSLPADAEVRHSTFRSAALGRDVAYAVQLPPSYAAGDRRYPVLHLLHGLFEGPGFWEERGLPRILEDLWRAGDVPEMIVVAADGDAPWAGVAGDALPLPTYPPASVVSASYAGNQVTLAFDVPVWLNGTGGGGPTPDDSVKFDGNVPFSVVQINDHTLQFMVGGSLGPGSTWVIERQPAWIGADVAAPQSGEFA